MMVEVAAQRLLRESRAARRSEAERDSAAAAATAAAAAAAAAFLQTPHEPRCNYLSILKTQSVSD